MKALYCALLEFQRKVGPVAKNAKNDFHKSSYSTLDELIDTVRPVLADCELGFYQVVVGADLKTVLYHTSGESVESTISIESLLDRAGISDARRGQALIEAAARGNLDSLRLLIDCGAGAPLKVNVLQSYGAALTYLRRYSLFAILGLAPDDDDGQGFAGGSKAQPGGKIKSVQPAPPKRLGPDQTKNLPPAPIYPQERSAYIQAFGTIEELQSFFDQRRAAKSLESMRLSELSDMQFFQLSDLFIAERKNK